MEKSSAPLKPEPLKFEPDLKRLERLARFRRVVLMVTLGMMVLALLWVLFLPNRVMTVGQKFEQLPSRTEPATVVVPEAKVAETSVAPVPLSKVVKLDPVQEARGLVLGVDSSLSSAIEQWERSAAVVNAISVRLENVPEILKHIGLARAMSESAGMRFKGAQDCLSRLRSLLGGAGLTGARINAAYAAARDFASLVAEEAADRQGWLDSYEQAIRALANGDSAQFDIKMNVAGAYQRQVEVRQRRLRRAGALLRSAVQDWQ
jgi:hypothetical protein